MRGAIKILLLYGFFSVSGFAWAETAAPEEEQAFREFPSEKLEQYRSDSDYNYQRPESSAPDWWERFTAWLAEVLQSLFGMVPSGEFVEYLIYTLSILILLWVLIRLTGMEVTGIMRGERKGGMPFRIAEENIDEIDFEKEMEAARTEGKWRLLIRLQYLYALKQLADKGILEVKPGKTNHDYIYEISAGELRDPFSRLSRIFEYTWYGHFEVDTRVAERAGQELSALQKNLAA